MSREDDDKYFEGFSVFNESDTPSARAVTSPPVASRNQGHFRGNSQPSVSDEEFFTDPLKYSNERVSPPQTPPCAMQNGVIGRSPPSAPLSADDRYFSNVPVMQPAWGLQSEEPTQRIPRSFIEALDTGKAMIGNQGATPPTELKGKWTMSGNLFGDTPAPHGRGGNGGRGR